MMKSFITPGSSSGVCSVTSHKGCKIRGAKAGPLVRCPQNSKPNKRCCKIKASSTIDDVEGLSDEDKINWKDCCTALEDIGLSQEEASAAVKRGFGWGSMAYWRSEKVKMAPNVTTVHECFHTLESIGIENKSDWAEIIKKFPEVLCIDKELIANNISKLEKSFFLKGKALAMSLKRKPRVLGATVDCQGDCAGECTRCFAQF